MVPQDAQPSKPEVSSFILYKQKVENLGYDDSLRRVSVEDRTDAPAPTDAERSPSTFQEPAHSGGYEPVLQLSLKTAAAAPDTSIYLNLHEQLPTSIAQPQIMLWVLQGILLGALTFIAFMFIVLWVLR